MKNSKLTVKWAIPFALTGLMRDVVYSFVTSFYLIFLIKTHTMSMKAAVTLIVLAKLFDIAKEPFLGMLMDVAGSRLGFNKFRFFTLTGSALNSLMLVLLFNYSEHSELLCIVLFLLWTLSFSVFDLPFWSVISSFDSGNRQREILCSIARTSAVLGFCLPLVITSVLYDSTQSIPLEFFKKAACVIAAAGFICTLIFSASKKHNHCKTKPIPYKNVLNLLFSNDQLSVTFVVTLLQQVAICVFIFSFELYLSKVNYSSNSEAFLLLQMPWILFALLCFASFHELIKIFSRKVIFHASTVMIITGYLGVFICSIAGLTHPVFASALLALTAGGFALSLNSTTVMTADCVDYGEFRFGYRTECLNFSIQTCSAKVGHLMVFMISGLSFSYADVFIRNDDISSKLYTISLDLIMVFACTIAMTLIYSFYYKLHGSFFEKILNTVSSFGTSSPNPAKDNANAVRYALDEHCVIYDLDSDNLDEILKVLTDRLYNVRAISSKAGFLNGIKRKLELNPAGIAQGIAIPHARGDFVKRSALAVALLHKSIECGSIDGEPCDLVFLIAATDDGHSHINLLGNLSLMLSEPGFADSLRNCRSSEEITRRLISCEKILFK